MSLVLILAAVAGLHLVFLRNAFAQALAPAQTPQPEVILTKLSPPVYPPLARQARIAGEVRVEVSIRKDGTLAPARLLSGHPMLAPAALESAKQSTFECRTCVEPLTTYLLTCLRAISVRKVPISLEMRQSVVSTNWQFVTATPRSSSLPLAPVPAAG